MVHRLWSDSNVLLSNIMEMFVKKAPNFNKDLKQLDLDNRSGWKRLEQLDIGDAVRAALTKVSLELNDVLLHTFRSSAKAMAVYLQDKLPSTNSILKRCTYLCSVTRKGVVEEDHDEPRSKKAV